MDLRRAFDGLDDAFKHRQDAIAGRIHNTALVPLDMVTEDRVAGVECGDGCFLNQLRELATVAERHGWEVVATYTDEGISGAKGRDRRPGYDALCEAVGRREADLVAAWSVDRLGRSLRDLEHDSA